MHFQLAILLTVIGPLLYWILPYVRDRTLRKIPGPLLGAFSNLWLLYEARQGRRSVSVHKLHQRLGPVVRLQPRHVSIADASIIHTIYGYGGGWTKSDFYDGFLVIHPNLFTTRSREVHTSKRKMAGPVFAPKAVVQYEPFIKGQIQLLLNQWDYLSSKIGKETSPTIDLILWCHYLTFDLTSDLSFGSPFGMLPKGADIAEVQEYPGAPLKKVSAIQVLNLRTTTGATLGCYSPLLQWAKYSPDPVLRHGITKTKDFAGLAIAKVGARLKLEEEYRENNTPDEKRRKDIMGRLMEAKDDNGEPLNRQELTSQALTQIVAGSDTTSNTLCAGFYWIMRTPGVQERLQKELDAVIPADIEIPDFNLVKDLPYLRNTINETLRIHSTVSMGLPRVVPPSGYTYNPPNGKPIFFSPGTVLSIPIYTIHHSPEIWNSPNTPTSGPDFHPDKFNPDRFRPENFSDLQKKSFMPFSVGPRACIGRSIAEMEMVLIVATVIRRYRFQLREKDDTAGLDIREALLRRPTRCLTDITRRTEDLVGRKGEGIIVREKEVMEHE